MYPLKTQYLEAFLLVYYRIFLYSEGDIKQVGKLNQIHPESISKGQLAYAVAQIYGNHTKASGAIIKFSYKEKSKTDVVYEVPITWG